MRVRDQAYCISNPDFQDQRYTFVTALLYRVVMPFLTEPEQLRGPVSLAQTDSDLAHAIQESPVWREGSSQGTAAR